MANLYVRSTDGNNADNGTTWALAKATIAGAGAIDAVGDITWVSQSHAETSASTINISTTAGDDGTPGRVICGNDGAAPPTAGATTATVTTTAAVDMNITGGQTYFYGISFISGSGASAQANFNIGNGSNQLIFENCSFQCASTGTGLILLDGTSGNLVNASVKLINCTFKFANTGGKFVPLGRIEIIGGSILSGVANINGGLFSANGPCKVLVTGFDMTNCGSSLYLVSPNNCGEEYLFRNCKLPTSWSQLLVSGNNPFRGSRYEMQNCKGAGGTLFDRIDQRPGVITRETTLIRTSGAADFNSSGFSFKLSSNSACSFPANAICTEEIHKLNTVTGSSQTATAEILHDSATALKDDEAWLEVLYLGTSGQLLYTQITDAKAGVWATGANQTTSSATWTTTGMSNPNKQKLEVTFTAQVAGYLIWRVWLAKASKIIYVCPKLAVA